MIYIWLNAIPIGLATLVALLLGLLYARRRQGRAPVRLTPGLLALAILCIAWFAAILAGALILAPPQAPPWVMAIGTAAVIWAGFVLPVILVTGRLRGGPGGQPWLDALWWLAAMLLMAVVMQSWGLVPPPQPASSLSPPPGSATARGSAPG